MVESKKEYGFMSIIKDGLNYSFQIILASIFSQITESINLIIKDIEKKIIQIEKRMLRKILSLLIILFGGIFLILGIFFFLIEFLGWSKTVAFFFIGLNVIVIGFMLKVAGYDK